MPPPARKRASNLLPVAVIILVASVVVFVKFVIDPTQPEARPKTGQTPLGSGKASEPAPADPARAAYEVARGLVASGRTDDAKAALRRIKPAAEADAGSLRAAGGLAFELKDVSLAERFLKRATELAPSVAGIHEEYGLALAMLHRRDEAIRELRSACDLDPASASARLNLAVVYGQLGRNGEAREQAQAALRLRPDYAQARGLLHDLQPAPMADSGHAR